MYSKLFTLALLSLVAVACSSKSKTTPVVTAAAPAATTATPSVASSPVPVATPVEKAVAEENAETIVCELAKESRQLRLMAKQPKGCELLYSNFSKKDPVASSMIGNTHCQKVQGNIKQKLEAAGYKCNLLMKASTPVASPTPMATPTPAAVSTPKK